MGDRMSPEPNPFVWATKRGALWSPARIDCELAYLRSQRFFQHLGHSIEQGSLRIQGRIGLKPQETGKLQTMTIRVEYSAAYPWEVPKVFDHEGQFQPSANGHLFSDHRLCLSFPPRGEFAVGSETLACEVLGASLIWLDKRFIFERTTKWPGEAEEHGWAKPLRKLLIEEANRSGAISLKAWTNWVVEDLVTPQYDGGCPCCSGRTFKLCHRRMAILACLYAFWSREEEELHGQRTTLEAA